MAAINFAAFTWEAFATLFTGILAVGGAVYVGTRQVKISDRQTRILENQARIDTLKYRADLFERRFEVYEATGHFLAMIMQKAAEPDEEIKRRFLRASDAAKLLFAPQVARNLDDVWKDAIQFFATNREMKANFDRTEVYGDPGLIKANTDQLLRLNKHLESLSDLFGPELRLGDLADAVG